MMRKTFLFSLIVFCSFCILSAKENLKTVEKENPSASKTVTILTESQVQVQPEVGIVTLHFTAYGWTVDKARKKADLLIRKFLDKLEKGKILPDHVQIGPARLKPSYQFNRDLKTNVPADFLISRQVILHLEDLSSIGKLMDVSISIGSFSLESVLLTVKDKSELEQKAFQKAMEDGKRKAEEIAKSLGARLDEVLNVEELAFGIQEINLIQETDFAVAASNQLSDKNKDSQTVSEKESSEKNESTLQSGEGFLALPEGEQKNLSLNDLIRAKYKLKITFSVR